MPQLFKCDCEMLPPLPPPPLPRAVHRNHKVPLVVKIWARLGIFRPRQGLAVVYLGRGLSRLTDVDMNLAACGGAVVASHRSTPPRNPWPVPLHLGGEKRQAGD